MDQKTMNVIDADTIPAKYTKRGQIWHRNAFDLHGKSAALKKLDKVRIR